MRAAFGLAIEIAWRTAMLIRGPNPASTEQRRGLNLNG